MSLCIQSNVFHSTVYPCTKANSSETKRVCSEGSLSRRCCSADVKARCLAVLMCPLFDSVDRKQCSVRSTGQFTQARWGRRLL